MCRRMAMANGEVCSSAHNPCEPTRTKCVWLQGWRCACHMPASRRPWWALGPTCATGGATLLERPQETLCKRGKTPAHRWWGQPWACDMVVRGKTSVPLGLLGSWRLGGRRSCESGCRDAPAPKARSRARGGGSTTSSLARLLRAARAPRGRHGAHTFVRLTRSQSPARRGGGS